MINEPDIDDLLATRGARYGNPAVNHARIANLWTAYLRVKITPAEAAMCMALLKVARLIETPNDEDSIHDLAGYVEVYRRIVNEGGAA
jgi:hypothetical protein